MNLKVSLYLALAASLPLSAAPHRYDHVVIVIEENRAVDSIIGDLTNAPYINSLAAGGVSMGGMFAIEHPSQPNYFQLFSGDNQGVEDDNLPPNYSTTVTATYPFHAPNLAAELFSAGFTFAGYSESLETAGIADWADYDPHSATNPGVTYRRKHNPWANWVAKVSPMPANQLPTSVNLSFTQFPADYSLLPSVSIVVPNQDHDMHDGSRKTGDTWLQTNLNGYAQWAKTHNSLLIITWDEDDYALTNQIATVLYGANLREGTVASGTWTHHNMLRTLEDMYGSSTHAGSADLVRPIVGPFIDAPDTVAHSFRQGLNGYSGSKDTMLREETPSANNAVNEDLNVDLNTSSNRISQGLVRFDNLFGNAAGQVPTGAIIHSAKLLLYTPDVGSSQSDDTMRAHRMIADWSDTATWDSFGSGVSINDTEAASSANFHFIPEVAGAPAIVDVTTDIELFQSGAAVNHGWLLRASTSGAGDGWTFKSGETSADTTQRPRLEIVYSLPATSAYDQWTALALPGNPNTAPSDDPDHDGSVNLLEFAFGTNPAIPDNHSLDLTAAGSITFPQRKNNGLSYNAEFSGDLKNWSAGQTPVVTNIETEWESVTVQDTAAIGTPNRFARIRVVQNP